MVDASLALVSPQPPSFFLAYAKHSKQDAQLEHKGTYRRRSSKARIPRDEACDRCARSFLALYGAIG